jgi:hypothetical protein
MRSEGHLPSESLPSSSSTLVTTLAWTLNHRLSTVSEPDDDELTILSWMLAGAIASHCSNVATTTSMELQPRVLDILRRHRTHTYREHRNLDLVAQAVAAVNTTPSHAVAESKS